MKESIRGVGKDFSSHRMVKEYSTHFYIPALENYKTFTQNSFQKARDVASYVKKIRDYWDQIQIKELIFPSQPILLIGNTLDASAHIELGELSPEDVTVELYYGRITAEETFDDPQRTVMEVSEKKGNRYIYNVKVQCRQTGRQGYTVRVLPRHQALVHPFLPDLIKWA
jgi:starch phosphorylase